MELSIFIVISETLKLLIVSPLYVSSAHLRNCSILSVKEDDTDKGGPAIANR